MPKPDASSPGDQTRSYPDLDNKRLLAELAEAILAAKQPPPSPVSDEAKASARQYAQIKRVLGTWAEPFPNQGGASARASEE